MQVYSNQVSCPKYIIKINFIKMPAFLIAENDTKKEKNVYSCSWKAQVKFLHFAGMMNQKWHDHFQ